jgi:hypothetical protein
MGSIPFDGHFLLAVVSVGGILVGANSDMFIVTLVDILNFSVFVFLQDKKVGFN